MQSFPLRFVAVRAALGSSLLAWAAPSTSAPDPDAATMLFAEAKVICARDGAGLWGRDLCGPILLVDPSDRAIVANQADADGLLKPAATNFVGILPDAVNVSNTPTDWAGVRWTQLTWPFSFETMNRRVVLAHELFHRIQTDLGLTRPETGNRHLDKFDGRYLLQLEWRALARALTAVTPAERRTAIADALHFRRERYRHFPAAAAEEAALEINEGIPEYTGVKLGLLTVQEQVAYAVYDLSRFVEAPTFVRSFAYATGPAYGLLLDQAKPGWRAELGSGRGLDGILADALSLPDLLAGSLKARAAVYDDGSLQAREERREAERRARLQAFKARLVDGPVLSLPIIHGNYQFNPQTLTPLDGFGLIYPSVRLTDVWGVLEVDNGGALVLDGKSSLNVSTKGIAPSHLTGNGWRLMLKEGWTVQSGTRPNDFQLMRTSQSSS